MNLYRRASCTENSSIESVSNDIYETTVKVPRNLGMEEELALLTKAARKVFEDYFPGEGGLPE